MNPLELLKQKLMVKPTIEEREHVAVVIKGDKKPTLKKREKKEDMKVEEEEEEEEEYKIVPKTTAPLIIDETHKGYDRAALMKKLAESKLIKVTIKPIIEKSEAKKVVEPIPTIMPKKAKKIEIRKPLLIIEDDEDENEEKEVEQEKIQIEPKKKVRLIIEGEEPEIIPIQAPKKYERKTKKIEKGIAVLGPETMIDFGDTDLVKRLPKRESPINIKVSSYYMNNRELFINFINSLFEPYRLELQRNKESISCDTIGNTSSSFSLLTHQKIVRDYMNLYTPYRGLLLYHGLGSGKTATSIAIAEGMKESKRVIIMTPASLRANYIEELKKAGDLLYKRNQYWEWISTDTNPEAAQPMSAILNLPLEYIRRHKGAFFINVKKVSNYDELSDMNKKILEEQLNEMIMSKYTFINYNGLRKKKLQELTSNYTKNIFDNSVVIVDEAHNLISRIVNKLQKEKEIPEVKRGDQQRMSFELAKKLSDLLSIVKDIKDLKKADFDKNEEKIKGLLLIIKGTSELDSNENKILDKTLNELLYNIKKIDTLKDDKDSKEIIADLIKKIDDSNKSINEIIKRLKDKPVLVSRQGEKEYLPFNLATKLYEFLLSAKNARIVLLTGTPVINYPNEFGILFNILRGYIKTWKIPIVVKSNKKIDRNVLQEMLLGEKSLDYLDYSPSSKVLTITRNPFGFKNKIKKESGYQGVSNVKKDEKGNTTIDSEFSSEDDFERKIISILKRNDIDVISDGIIVKNYKALPDDLDTFVSRYIGSDLKIKNIDALKRRIVGLSSYFKSAQESLLPRFNKALGVDYHVVRIPMSNFQFKIYESARQNERQESVNNQPKVVISNSEYAYQEPSSTYRIFSRLFCNFVMPDRPIPIVDTGKFKDKDKVKDKDKEGDSNEMSNLLKLAKKEESKQDIDNEDEGEIEGDEILDELGGTLYKENLELALKNIKDHSDDFLTPEALQTYSPKFLNILENIKDPEYLGLHLVYTQFRTMEGIGLFSLVLDKNGFTRFKVKKNDRGIWEIDIDDSDRGKPTYALYTGTETSEEKELVRHIYNGEWDQIPDNISSELEKIAANNNMGEIIKVFMITSSGSEGINLRNTRYVHIVEPYWHPVRLEQVIGRARRICSHKALPLALQTVEVFVYLMIFTPEQLKSDEAIELKRKDLSKLDLNTPITTDQYLYEISGIKEKLTSQLTTAIKESAFDCSIYSNGNCVNFGDPTNDKFAYVPNYAEQQNDTTIQGNKIAIDWVGKPITLNGIEYIYRRINKKLINIYDKDSYKEALVNSSVIPLQIGTLETNENGENVFKQLVT